ncbi:toll/interleukin-1 receptor domain-containing protein [Terriglobus sp. TAA 43]|uniref:toll/interleukin-1 receptor domain-containing protein n=1 Tax=Terriglobus sp. TAA 43 TaxID=278961 RepID=UPI00068A2DB1|nr:TIR domain-containing protein [Terriglobus sp. TAA 43]
MEITPDYDIALSFAGEDRKHADALNRALTGRGVRVFYDADVEHDLWGRNLYDYLDEVYRKRARYCIVFVSAAYARKNWTSHERRSAQARALQENEAYILPVRIDDTEIPGILPTTAYLDLQSHSIVAIADLVVTKLGISPQQVALDSRKADFQSPAELTFRSLLDPDVEHFTKSLGPFLRWQESALLNELPLKIEWPSIVASWISENCRMIQMNQWPAGISEEAKAQTRELFSAQLSKPETTRLASGIRICAAIIRDLADDRYANAGLSSSEIRMFLTAYISAEMAAHVTQLASMLLINMGHPDWFIPFNEYIPNYGCDFMPGLVLISKNAGREHVLWTDMDFYHESRITKYLYFPASVLIRYEKPLESKEVLHTILMPQLVAMAAEGRIAWNYVSQVAKYPDRFRVGTRGELFYDVETLGQPQHAQAQLSEKLLTWVDQKIHQGGLGEIGLSLDAKNLDLGTQLEFAHWQALSRTRLR